MRAKTSSGGWSVAALGGYGVFGQNCTVYLTSSDCLVVDAGLRFNPDGTTSFIEDTSLFQKRPPTAYIMTHGHEDHIGGLPYLLNRYPAPVFANAFTMGLIRRRFESMSLPLVDTHVVEFDEDVHAASVVWKFVRLPHSIPSASAVVLDLCGDRVFHSGDFKLNGLGQPFCSDALRDLETLGDEGITVLVSDSTNAIARGFCPGEDLVLHATSTILSQTPGRIFITSFASNVHRLYRMAELAVKHGRPVIIDSNSMRQNLLLALECGELGDSTMVHNILATPVSSAYATTNPVVLISGSQGESTSGLRRLSKHAHNAYTLTGKDTVVFSSRVIPGNEDGARSLYDDLRLTGCKIIDHRTYPEIHVSGHGCGGDLSLLATLLRPTFAIPMHGGDAMILAARERLVEAGVEYGNTFVSKEPLLWQRTSDGFEQFALEKVVAYRDDKSSSVVSASAQATRERSFHHGFLAVECSYDLTHNKIALPPVFSSFGVSGTPERVDQVLQGCSQHIQKIITHEIEKERSRSREFISRAIEESVRKILMKELGIRPIVFASFQLFGV
jgi:ribonuclease J